MIVDGAQWTVDSGHSGAMKDFDAIPRYQFLYGKYESISKNGRCVFDDADDGFNTILFLCSNGLPIDILLTLH